MRHYPVLSRTFSVANFADLGYSIDQAIHSSQPLAFRTNPKTRTSSDIQFRKIASAQAYAELKMSEICSPKALLISLLTLSRVVTSRMSSSPNTWSVNACFPAHSPDSAVEDNKLKG